MFLTSIVTSADYVGCRFSFSNLIKTYLFPTLSAAKWEKEHNSYDCYCQLGVILCYLVHCVLPREYANVGSVSE